MNKESLLIFAAITVSWVLFIFNFVLGYYMGRAVEAAEQVINKKKSKKKKNKDTKFSSTDK